MPDTYVEVLHEPGVWVRARVEKQWRHGGRWRLSCYHYVELLQHYRVYDAVPVPAGGISLRNVRGAR